MTRPLHDLDIRTVRNTLERIANPPQDSKDPLFTLEFRLKNWNWASHQVLYWLIAESDAGRKIPDSECPDLMGSYQIPNEETLKKLATALLQYLQPLA